MCDLNWCPVCEKAISCESDALYCSVNCFLLDTKSQINPTKFLSFLKPKSLLRRKKQECSNHLPPLTKSMYTASSLSSTESHFGFGDSTNDDLELPECCDYCDSVKHAQQQQQQEQQKPSLNDHALYPNPSSAPISIPIR
ncbi:hypothetical protein V8B55DRAFT_1447257 [Mucor lusitanicus]|uniref:Uncharacterized protein n=1 Tax=Mucor lusitanicus CBS 277.49 TaxID=747725 RepID=A0A162U2R7_MUCCL|nr:hypothetical protein MUCCIDRAFT_155071 [Mucor lusitanicus CBS 277.49]